MTAAKIAPSPAEHDSLTAALASVQAALPHVLKGKTANTGTYSYKYADLADCASAIHPLLGAAGLAFVTMPTMAGDRFVLAYSLRHVSGEQLDGTYPLPDPTRTDAQKVGSAITYARRYVLCCATGIVPDEDDDGRHAANATDYVERPAAPAPVRVTDARWLEHWRVTTLAADTVPLLRGQEGAARAAWESGTLTSADAADCRALVEERMAELQQRPGPVQQAEDDLARLAGAGAQ